MSFSVLFVLVLWISMIPHQCYSALSEGEFEKCSLCSSMCLFFIARLPDILSHPVFLRELEFKKENFGILRVCFYRSVPKSLKIPNKKN